MDRQQIGLTLIISAFLLTVGVYIVAYIPYRDIESGLTSCVINCPTNELTPTLYVSSIMLLVILIVGLFLFASKEKSK